MQFSLPSPKCFTSGEAIPFMLSLACEDAPILATLLAPNIRIGLIKRTRLYRRGGRDISTRDVSIAAAEVLQIEDWSERVALVRGEIQAGSAGEECSWRVDGIAEVQVSGDIPVLCFPVNLRLGGST